ncbi:uncharacterized protein LOC111702048 [Eurytemora carolleeae]|uniref:uncharacterized protein LOC111702048 n=1 Tax=Eurytemora carolleeae TaxID=1294199 RepID=UPI000C7887D7|nr:uncharacterized protein LOC111702048 [Eurytemora carolleeae]|eukprot:XP_023329341.1 uncharacterized protein LOC111702048 [Eurytemora affinis]
MFVTTSCLIPQIDGYPTSKTSCSVGHRLDIPLYEKPICERQILIPYPDCQIQSNMVLSSAPEHAAANILSETLAWSAPIRTGPKWEIYVQIDFRTIMRITRIFLGFPQTSRGPSKIRIDTSKNTNTFMKGETAIIRYDKKLLIKESIVARSIRLVVVETNDATPTLKAISINSVKFYGCPLYSPYNISENLEARMSLKGPERKKGVEWCASSQEITSDDPRQYRQFAVDTLHENIIYLCDVGEYKDAQPCWLSIIQGRWKALPLYIHSILGFSLEKGRMYLLDKDAQVYFSSVDGIRLEISRFDNLTMLLPGWIPAVSVPGLSINQLNFAWPDSTITANFYGLQQNGNNILNWQSCCINPN